MPKQLITLEVNYPLVHSGEDTDNEPVLRPEPKHWPWESLCDDWDNPDEADTRTYTRGVRLVASSPPTYDDTDRAEAAEHETTLLELGVHE